MKATGLLNVKANVKAIEMLKLADRIGSDQEQDAVALGKKFNMTPINIKHYLFLNDIPSDAKELFSKGVVGLQSLVEFYPIHGNNLIKALKELSDVKLANRTKKLPTIKISRKEILLHFNCNPAVKKALDLGDINQFGEGDVLTDTSRSSLELTTDGALKIINGIQKGHISNKDIEALRTYINNISDFTSSASLEPTYEYSDEQTDSFNPESNYREEQLTFPEDQWSTEGQWNAEDENQDIYNQD